MSKLAGTGIAGKIVVPGERRHRWGVKFGSVEPGKVGGDRPKMISGDHAAFCYVGSELATYPPGVGRLPNAA